MMFAAGMVIGAVCGVCIMCVVSCKRAEQYEAMQRYLESRWYEAVRESETYKTLHKQANDAYVAYVNNAISDKRRLAEQDAIIRELQDELRCSD